MMKPEFFYKYVDIKGAASILKNLAIKWTCPIYFNDPFDIRQELGFGFDEREFYEAYKNRSIDLMHSEAPVYKDVKSWTSMRSMRNGSTKRDSEPFWAGEKDKIIQNHRDQLQQFQQAWKYQIRKYRVLCLSENDNNLLMWSHYADSHQGVLFKFRCIDHPSAHFRDTKQVQYNTALPVVATLSQWANWLIGASPPDSIDDKEIFHRVVFTKSTDWDYEKEWRCIVELDQEPNAERHDLYNLIPEEIDSVFFGCKMNDENRTLLIKYIKEFLSHVKTYQATKHLYEYKLHYERLI